MVVRSVVLGFDLSLECVEDMVLIQEELTEPLKAKGLNPFWTDPTEIRVALKYFPAMDDVLVQRVEETVQHIATRLVPFKVAARGVRPYPSAMCPRVLCSDMELGLDLVEGLRKVLELHLERLGMDRDTRPFRPNALLGRGRVEGDPVDVSSVLDELHDHNFRASYVKDLAMWGSDVRSRNGWTVMKRFRLGGRRKGGER